MQCDKGNVERIAQADSVKIEEERTVVGLKYNYIKSIDNNKLRQVATAGLRVRRTVVSQLLEYCEKINIRAE